VVIALSGGADSITLLDLFIRFQKQDNNFKLTAAHFNHQLRPEADQEQEQVANYCNRNGISIKIGSGNVSEYARDNKLAVHAAARELRYRFLIDTSQAELSSLKYSYFGHSREGENPVNCCYHWIPDQVRNDKQDILHDKSKNSELFKNRTVIATGHHLDDHVETVLMKLFSGSGVEGLSGIGRSEDWGDNVTVIHPLLDFRKEQIERYCQWRRLPVIHDSSNLDLSYPRNRIRHEVLSVIEKNMGSESISGIVRSAKLMSMTTDLVNAQLTEIWEDSVKFRCEHEFVLDCQRFCSYLTVLRLRMLQECARAVGQSVHRRSLERMESADRVINSGRTGTVELGGGVNLFSNTKNIYVYRIEYDFEIVELSVGDEVTFPEFGTLAITEGDAESETIPPPAGMLICDLDKLGTDKFAIRRAETGDKVIPYRMKGHRKVSDILRERGIPQHRRNFPLVWIKDQLAAIPPFRIADQFKVTSATKRIVKFLWQESELIKFYRADSE